MEIQQDLLKDKTLLVTGGTGSFGNQMVEELIRNHEPKEIIVYSRDEKKQYDMRNRFKSSKIRFIIGDTRDRESVR